MKHINNEVFLSNTNGSLQQHTQDQRHYKLNAFVKNSILYSAVFTALSCTVYPTVALTSSDTIGKEVTFDFTDTTINTFGSTSKAQNGNNQAGTQGTKGEDKATHKEGHVDIDNKGNSITLTGHKGGTGQDGQNSTEVNGKDAVKGKVDIIVHGMKDTNINKTADITIKLDGCQGDEGGDGADGVKGGTGGKGAYVNRDEASGNTPMRHTFGGAGGDGGNGSMGGKGRNGGQGGNISAKLFELDSKTTEQTLIINGKISVTSQGGQGGDGGIGGDVVNGTNHPNQDYSPNTYGKSQAGVGGQGGSGGQGGNGGAGGDSHITVIDYKGKGADKTHVTIKVNSIDVTSKGVMDGNAGQGGLFGDAGIGGNEGKGHYCYLPTMTAGAACMTDEHKETSGQNGSSLGNGNNGAAGITENNNATANGIVLDALTAHIGSANGQALNINVKTEIVDNAEAWGIKAKDSKLILTSDVKVTSSNKHYVNKVPEIDHSKKGVSLENTHVSFEDAKGYHSLETDTLNTHGQNNVFEFRVGVDSGKNDKLVVSNINTNNEKLILRLMTMNLLKNL